MLACEQAADAERQQTNKCTCADKTIQVSDSPVRTRCSQGILPIRMGCISGFGNRNALLRHEWATSSGDKAQILGYPTRVFKLGWGFSPLISTYWRREHWTPLFASVTYIGAEVVSSVRAPI